MTADAIATDPAHQAAAPRIRGPVVLFMSLAAAIGTATIYLMQPAIAVVADSLGSTITATGVALAGGPIGYLIGLCLFVPLVDRYPPGRVIAAQFGVLAAALATTSAMTGVALVGVLVVVIGACSVVGASLSSVVGRVAAPGRRAVTLGVVTAGISAGILIGRIAGGWLADDIGWRAMLRVFAVACALVGACCLFMLPATGGPAGRGYLATVRSLPILLVRNATLRIAAFRGALWFFAFCTVWAGLAVALSAPPYSYSAERIGLYALAGLSGMLATPVAGAMTDRFGARRVIVVGLVVAGVATILIGISLSNTILTLVCLALFDAGLFAAQVANQSTVLAIDPAAPARFNSAYMVVYFAGGSLGTAVAAAADDGFGWPATAGMAVIAIAAAGAVTVFVGQRSR